MEEKEEEDGAGWWWEWLGRRVVIERERESTWAFGCCDEKTNAVPAEHE